MGYRISGFAELLFTGLIDFVYLITAPDRNAALAERVKTGRVVICMSQNQQRDADVFAIRHTPRNYVAISHS